MPQADLLILNGNVFTADERMPFARALAVRGNRIVWVGSDEDAMAWRGANMRVIDAGGNTVMPGIIDSHFHLLMGSLEAADLQLEQAETLDEVAASLQGWAATRRDGDEQWLVGWQLRYAAIPADRVLNRALDRHFLDRIVAD